MRSFDQLLGLLSDIPGPRRAEGKLYKLPGIDKNSARIQRNRRGLQDQRRAAVLPTADRQRRRRAFPDGHHSPAPESTIASCGQVWPLGHLCQATAYTFHRNQPPAQRNPRKADLVPPPVLKWREAYQNLLLAADAYRALRAKIFKVWHQETRDMTRIDDLFWAPSRPSEVNVTMPRGLLKPAADTLLR